MNGCELCGLKPQFEIQSDSLKEGPPIKACALHLGVMVGGILKAMEKKFGPRPMRSVRIVAYPACMSDGDV